MALGLTAWFSLVPTGSLWLGLGTEHSPLLSPELLYEDVFAVWEVIWAARHISSEHFVLFIALALVEAYREIIRDNNMDFTDIIKFFNGTCRPGHLAVSSKAAGSRLLTLVESEGSLPLVGTSRVFSALLLSAHHPLPGPSLSHPCFPRMG